MGGYLRSGTVLSGEHQAERTAPQQLDYERRRQDDGEEGDDGRPERGHPHG
jgi:hypothetical protein